MSALVTGVGYIGAPLANRLLDRGERVVGLESFFCTPREALAGLAENPRFTLVEGDVAESADVARAFDSLAPGEPLVVYHLAAQPSASVAARDPAYTERTNLVGSRLVLEAARERGASVVFGGSLRVYGDDLAGQTVDESTLYGRMSDLSHLSKLWVEQLARMLGSPFVSARLGVVYGLSPVMKSDPSYMTVPNLFSARAAHGEPLRILEDRPMGFVHVDDAVEALLAAPRLLGDGAWQVANAVGEVRTIGDVARTVQRLALDRGLRVEVDGSTTSDSSFAVTSRLERKGFRSTRTMDESLGVVLDYFQGHAA